MRQRYTDVEFEIVSDPRGRRIVPWKAQREPKRRLNALEIIQWSYVGLLAGVAALTALVGLLGGDVDTRPAPKPAARALPANVIAIPPVESSR